MKNPKLQSILEQIHEVLGEAVHDILTDQDIESLAKAPTMRIALDLMKHNGIALELETGSALGKLDGILRQMDEADADDPYANRH